MACSVLHASLPAARLVSKPQQRRSSLITAAQAQRQPVSAGSRAQTATVSTPGELLNRGGSLHEAVLKYNADMAEKMGWKHLDNPFEYNHAGPLYFHYIAPDMIVGAQPRSALDVDVLAAEGVDVILNLQQDKDLAYWKVDLREISSRAQHHGMELIRTPAVDFSPHSLREALPAAVRALEASRAAGRKVYVHCTAGLGRSPAVAIAALYWFTPLQLDEAYAFLTGIRPCGPNKDAIRGATYDLLSGRPKEHFAHEPPHAFATLSDADRRRLRQLLGLPELTAAERELPAPALAC